MTIAAATLAFLHTISGPDHSIPFIGMARAGRWPLQKTLQVTILGGLGHVLSSAVLAVVGLTALAGTERALSLESLRGELAVWGLMAFGLLYGAWGLRRVARGREHDHWHAHADGTLHHHRHAHQGDHLHAHGQESARLTPWILFAIFVFGPCEPLIPLLMYPAIRRSLLATLWVGAVFTLVTILTMVALVLGGLRGLQALRIDGLTRYAHALAGVTIFGCGLAVKVFGL